MSHFESPAMAVRESHVIVRRSTGSWNVFNTFTGSLQIGRTPSRNVEGNSGVYVVMQNTDALGKKNGFVRFELERPEAVEAIRQMAEALEIDLKTI